MKLRFSVQVATFASLIALATIPHHATAGQGIAPAKSLPNIQYVEKLKSDFGERIVYADDYSREYANRYMIDCRASDSRTLRLSTLLLARAASASKPDMWLSTFVEAKENEIRVYDHLVKPGGEWITEPTLRLEVNDWGDLTSYGIRIEAILNSCFGTYGPIWE
ncbi:hypothetical protein SAMN05444064_10387 [Pseudomonas syringae]|uniref:hypothetical protein n=1 Tax=Pseudomonas syringae TaxID=317 RepID=UPI0008946E46|nr:hypothetical protein [Pseudomonas syringae]SDW37053.1 hypothetical protein SAMN05444514_10387 [Pseudomonas syringae]SFL65557.1 hypothetical protein SAMN05444064_10387 [Pseudomonas syringae]